MASAGWRNETGVPSTSSSPPLGRSRAGEDVEQLVLALALERDDARAPRPGRGRTRRRAASCRARGRGPRGGASRPRPARAAAAGAVGARRQRRSTISPSISSTIRSSEPAVDVDDADGLALAQHGGPVADGGDLDHAVGDEDDGAVAAPLAADDLEHALGEVRGQRRGHLVEHAARRARSRGRGRGR